MDEEIEISRGPTPLPQFRFLGGWSVCLAQNDHESHRFCGFPGGRPM